MQFSVMYNAGPVQRQSTVWNLSDAAVRQGRCRVRTSYDEGKILTDIVWRHYRHLFTKFEPKVAGWIMFEIKTRDVPPDFEKEPYFSRYAERDEAVMNALQEGHAAFQRRVRERILAEDGDQVYINRCPACRRIVRRPKAKQCLWCHHDWHGTT